MVLRTTSRSRAPGARISSVTRKFDAQNCRSPSNSLRSSLKERLSTGTSGRTTMAMSVAVANGGSARYAADSNRVRRSMAIIFGIYLSEREADLREGAVDTWQIATIVMPVFQLYRGKSRDIVAHPDRRCREAGNGAEDNV